MAFAGLAYFLLNEKKDPAGKGQSHFSVQTSQKPTGWAYRIYEDTTAVVEQVYIPGVSGTKGFADEQQAKKTGELVVKKLDAGIFPPSISQSELDSMDISY